MAERIRSNRRIASNGKIVRGVGVTSEVRRVAQARARLEGSGRTPDEMLREWADTGTMEYPSRKGKAGRRVELSPQDRISCAKGAAQFYKAPMKIPEEARPTVIVIDEEMVNKVKATGDVKLLEAMRDMLVDLQAGRLTKSSGDGDGAKRVNRFAEMLRADSPTVGAA